MSTLKHLKASRHEFLPELLASFYEVEGQTKVTLSTRLAKWPRNLQCERKGLSEHEVLILMLISVPRI